MVASGGRSEHSSCQGEWHWTTLVPRAPCRGEPGGLQPTLCKSGQTASLDNWNRQGRAHRWQRAFQAVKGSVCGSGVICVCHRLKGSHPPVDPAPLQPELRPKVSRSPAAQPLISRASVSQAALTEHRILQPWQEHLNMRQHPCQQNKTYCCVWPSPPCPAMPRTSHLSVLRETSVPTEEAGIAGAEKCRQRFHGACYWHSAAALALGPVHGRGHPALAVCLQGAGLPAARPGGGGPRGARPSTCAGRSRSAGLRLGL